MRDKTHMQSVERWAEFILKNPDTWKIIHTRFINSQFQKHNEFLKKLKKTKGGKEKIIELYRIRNLNGYKKLLK